jgi:adenine-specific DNA-methyltransferase
MVNTETTSLLAQLESFNAPQLRRLLVEHLTKQKLGLYWERNAIARDQALNANVVLPRVVPEFSYTPKGTTHHRNLVIEGDNFDSLRLLRATHAGKIRVIYIDPPYNTGNKDWVYNDKFVGANDRWRHSQWLEFLYQRLTLARELLTSDGVILVSINDENHARLELLMDEVFPGQKIGNFVWRTRQGSNDAKGGFLSIDPEYVLAYGNPGFEFAGSGRDETKYSNPDNDLRGDWGSQMLIKSHNAKERPEAYYPIHNSESETWYLCDPDSVWRFSSQTRPLNKKKLQAEPIETLIAQKSVLWPANEETVIYGSEKDLLAAIKSNRAPKQFRIYTQLPELQKLAEQDAKVARLLTYIPSLDHWVGKKLGYGRPRYKRFRNTLQRDSTPLSSWLSSMGDDDPEEFDDTFSLQVGVTAEGTSLVKKIVGNKDFPYPKPLSLIKALISQASKSDDTVLDFFAGSATTGQAVLELNAEDGGNRRFILCSSTEATVKEPDKNLCRDVCAERLRRVMVGYGGKPGYSVVHGGEFAYLQLDKIEAADVAFEATPAHATTLISLKDTALAPVEFAPAAIQVIATSGDWLTVICHEATPESVDILAALPAQHGLARLAVFCPRPKALAALLAERGVEANTYSIADALLKGQVRGGQQGAQA